MNIHYRNYLIRNRSIIKYRNDILKIICKKRDYYYEHNDIIELENYLIENEVVLENLNDKYFDILIYILYVFNVNQINNDKYAYEIIKYIIEHCKYDSLNYTFYHDNIYDVPLFLAIAYGRYNIADLLIKNGADINYQANYFYDQKMDIIQFLCFFYDNHFINKDAKYYTEETLYIDQGIHFNNSMINYIISKGFNITGKNLYKVIYNIAISDNSDKIEKFIQRYMYGNELTLLLLSIYKNKMALSDEQLQNIIKNEKKRIKFSNNLYLNSSSKSVAILLQYDGDEERIINQKIKNCCLIQKAIKSNDRHSMNKILNHISFSLDELNIENILINIQNNDQEVEIIKYFVESIKTREPNIYSKINFYRIIVETSKSIDKLYPLGRKASIINYYINILLNNILDSINENKSEYNNENNNENKKRKGKGKEKEKENENQNQNQNQINSSYSLSLLTIINLAIKVDNFEIIKRIMEDEKLKSMIDINSKDENDDYPIVVAFDNCVKKIEAHAHLSEFPTKIFDYLIKCGANYEIKRKGNQSIFSEAYEKDMYCIIKYILRPNPIMKELFQMVIFLNIQNLKSIILKDFLETMSNNVDRKDNYSSGSKLYNKLQIHKSSIEILEEKDISKYIQLLLAVYNNKLDKVKEIIGENNHNNDNNKELFKFNIIESLEIGYTPLILSYLLNYRDIFLYLLDHCNINNKSFLSYNILHYAIFNEDNETVERLIQLGIDTKMGMEEFNKLFDIALPIGNKDVVYTLIKSDKKNNFISDKNEMIYKILIYKSFYTFEDCSSLIQQIITEFNVDLNKVLNIFPYQTLLNFVIDSFFYVDYILIFLKNGADITMTDNTLPFIVNTAIDEGNTELIDYLIDSGSVDINDDSDISFLVKAIENRSLDMLEYLVNKGGDLGYITSNGDSLLTLAIRDQEKKCDIISYLIDKKTILTYDIKVSFYEIIENLSNEQIGIKLSQYIRDTQVHGFNDLKKLKEIIYDNRLDLLKNLIEQNILLDINAEDPYGHTLLTYALNFNRKKISKYLIKHGAKNIKIMNTKDKDNNNNNNNNVNNEIVTKNFKKRNLYHYPSSNQNSVKKVKLNLY